MQDKKFIMVIDQGTTSSRAVLFDENGKIYKKASQPLNMHYPKEGWVEQNPADITSSIIMSAVKVLARAKVAFDAISAI